MKDLIFNLINIDLQLFAEPNTNVTTDSGLSVENKTHYDMTLIDEASPNLIHDQFGQKRPIPKNGGKKIEFRKYASLPKALTPLTEGVTPDGKKLSVSAIEAEVNQYGDYVCLSDVLDMTAIDNNALEATKAIGKQAGLTLDTITRNVLQSGTNVFYCPPVAADGTVGAQPDDQRQLRLHPASLCRLRSDERPQMGRDAQVLQARRDVRRRDRPHRRCPLR